MPADPLPLWTTASKAEQQDKKEEKVFNHRRSKSLFRNGKDQEPKAKHRTYKAVDGAGFRRTHGFTHLGDTIPTARRLNPCSWQLRMHISAFKPSFRPKLMCPPINDLSVATTSTFTPCDSQCPTICLPQDVGFSSPRLALMSLATIHRTSTFLGTTPKKQETKQCTTSSSMLARLL